MKKDVIVEVTGKLRHDRWKDRATGRWIGKVFVAIDPGEGSLRSKGVARTPANPKPPNPLHAAAPRVRPLPFSEHSNDT